MPSGELLETSTGVTFAREVFVHMRFSLVLATLALSTLGFSQAPTNSNDGFYQLGFAANLNIGDSVVNITNDGINLTTVLPLGSTQGNICVNTYVFDPQEEEIGCCACLVTPNALNSLSVKADLISNNLTPAVPTSVVIKLLGSQPGTDKTGAFTICNPATAGTTPPTALEYGMVVWGSTLEPASTPGTYAPVNVPYATGQLFGVYTAVNTSIGDNFTANGFLKAATNVFGLTVNTSGNTPNVGTELSNLTSLCNFIQANGTGFGICKSCRLGALGGAKQ
jgi:hypothetical protein